MICQADVLGKLITGIIPVYTVLGSQENEIIYVNIYMHILFGVSIWALFGGYPGWVVGVWVGVGGGDGGGGGWWCWGWVVNSLWPR